MPEPPKPKPRNEDVRTETDKFIDSTNERMSVETAKLNKARENRHNTKEED